MVFLSLAIAGGPFVGLFGTVLGVVETFASVGSAGRAGSSAIAPGVAGALRVAIPALFASSLLTRWSRERGVLCARRSAGVNPDALVSSAPAWPARSRCRGS